MPSNWSWIEFRDFAARPKVAAVVRAIPTMIWGLLVAGWLILSQRIQSRAFEPEVSLTAWWYISLGVVSLVQVAVLLEAIIADLKGRRVQPGDFFIPFAWSLAAAGSGSPGRLLGAMLWAAVSVLVARTLSQTWMELVRSDRDAASNESSPQEVLEVASPIPVGLSPVTPEKTLCEQPATADGSIVVCEGVTDESVTDEGVTDEGEIHEGSESTDRVHWSQRTRESGHETIEGEVAASFEPGQRETTIHVSFCPPLSVTPELDVEDVGAGTTELRVTGVYPYGARIVARRTSDVEERLLTEIAYRASAPAA